MNIQRYYDASQAGWQGNGPILSGNFGAADRSRGLKGVLYGKRNAILKSFLKNLESPLQFNMSGIQLGYAFNKG